MVVVDSSALIPLIRIGRLDLLRKVFDKIIVPETVWEEVAVEGKKLGRPVKDFEEGGGKWFIVAKAKDSATEEGYIEKGDLAVFKTAKGRKDILLTNDAALYYYALSQGVKAYWLTTVLLIAAKRKKISRGEAEAILLELVNTAGMHLKSELMSELLMILRNM